MTTKKITKEILYTELKVLQAKVDKVVGMIEDQDVRIKVLEAELDTRLKNKYYPKETVFGTTGCLVCGKYDCPASYTNLPCPNYRSLAYTNAPVEDSFYIKEPPRPFLDLEKLATDKDDVEE